MKVSFIIPFHNEEKNCQQMVERVISYAQKKKYSFEVIAIDDRSSDSTAEILSHLAKKYKYIVHPVIRKSDIHAVGNTMGKALIEGTNLAKNEFIIWTMGDLADDTKTYGTILEKLREGYDMVFGSRYMPGGSRGTLDPIKAFMSSWGTLLARFLFGVPVHDITNAFRGFKKSVFQKIKLSSSGFSISPEFAIKTHLAGYKLGEVPTVYTNRVEGVSSFKLYNMTINYIHVYISLFLKYKILQKKLDIVR